MWPREPRPEPDLRNNFPIVELEGFSKRHGGGRENDVSPFALKGASYMPLGSSSRTVGPRGLAGVGDWFGVAMYYGLNDMGNFSPENWA